MSNFLLPSLAIRFTRVSPTSGRGFDVIFFIPTHCWGNLLSGGVTPIGRIADRSRSSPHTSQRELRRRPRSPVLTPGCGPNRRLGRSARACHLRARRQGALARGVGRGSVRGSGPRGRAGREGVGLAASRLGARGLRRRESSARVDADAPGESGCEGGAGRGWAGPRPGRRALGRRRRGRGSLLRPTPPLSADAPVPARSQRDPARVSGVGLATTVGGVFRKGPPPPPPGTSSRRPYSPSTRRGPGPSPRRGRRTAKRVMKHDTP